MMIGQGEPAVSLAKALGIKNVERLRAFTLRCAVNECVTVTCEYYQDADDISIEGVETVTSDYQLVAVGGSVPAQKEAGELVVKIKCDVDGSSIRDAITKLGMLTR